MLAAERCLPAVRLTPILTSPWVGTALNLATTLKRATVRLDRFDYCDSPCPGGESHSQAVQRVAGFPADLPTWWSGRRVMVIGHLATYRALEHVTNGLTVQELVAADIEWRAEGWEYRLG